MLLHARVEQLLATLTFHTDATLCARCSISNPVPCLWPRKSNRRRPKCMGPYHRWRNPRWCSWLSPVLCSHLGNEQADEKSCLLCNFAFQIKKPMFCFVFKCGLWPLLSWKSCAACWTSPHQITSFINDWFINYPIRLLQLNEIMHWLHNILSYALSTVLKYIFIL